MDRILVYPGAIPLETDHLNDARNAMIALAGIASALFGSTTTANALACTATSPASMSVKVGAGEIYAVANVDDSAYSSLPADTAHQIVKQGVNLDPVVLACPAPATAGQSIAYLIQANFAETDNGATVLPYYNSSDPTQAYSGPANSGAAQPTVRKGVVSVTVKPGIPAATGTQATPSPDVGCIGLYVVTVAYGATTVTSGNIAAVAGASVVPSGGLLNSIRYASRAEGLAGSATSRIVSPDVLAQTVQSGSFLYGVAGGTGNALSANLAPAPAYMQPGMEVIIKVTTANTGAATLALNGGSATSITFNSAPLRAGMLLAGQLYALIFDGTTWQLRAPSMNGIVAYALGATGYEVYSHGKIEQWGVTAIPSGTNSATFNINFPITFPNAAFGITGNGNNGAKSGWGALSIAFPNLTPTGCGVIADSANATQAIDTGRSLYWRVTGD